MNVIIMLENGETMEIGDCSKYEIQAGGDICTVKRADGSAININFRKVMLICEKSAFESAVFTRAAASGAARKK